MAKHFTLLAILQTVLATGIVGLAAYRTLRAPPPPAAAGASPTQEHGEAPAPKAVEAERPKQTDRAAIAEALLRGGASFHTYFEEHQEALARAQARRPLAMVLTCTDPEVAPEALFGRDLGDLYVVRTPGATLDAAALGALEHAAASLGAEVLVVLGHERCGIIAAAAAGEPPPTPTLKALREQLMPAIRPALGRPLEDVTHLAVAGQVLATARAVLQHSELLRERAALKRLSVLGAVYDASTGGLQTVPEPLEGEPWPEVAASSEVAARPLPDLRREPTRAPDAPAKERPEAEPAESERPPASGSTGAAEGDRRAVAAAPRAASGETSRKAPVAALPAQSARAERRPAGSAEPAQATPEAERPAPKAATLAAPANAPRRSEPPPPRARGPRSAAAPADLREKDGPPAQRAAPQSAPVADPLERAVALSPARRAESASPGSEEAAKGPRPEAPSTADPERPKAIHDEDTPPIPQRAVPGPAAPASPAPTPVRPPEARTPEAASEPAAPKPASARERAPARSRLPARNPAEETPVGARGPAPRAEDKPDAETVVRSGLRAALPSIEACYESELRRNEGLQGKILVSVTVNAAGEVASSRVVESTLKNPAVLECIKGRLRRLHFPEIGEEIEVGLPLTLVPRG